MRRAAGSIRLLLALVLLGAVLAACGRPGAPVPPERVAPLPPDELRAEVLAGGIEIGWNSPHRRADRGRLRDLVALHVFRAEDDGAGDPKPALVEKGRVAGYAEVATVRMADPAPAVLDGPRATIVDRAAMTPGRRYTYVILASDARGHVSPPSPRLSVTLIAAPLPPVEVRAVPGDGEVRVEWRPAPALSDGTRPEEPPAYQVLRGAPPEPPGTAVATTPAGATSFVDRGLDNERPYVYAVRAIRSVQDTVARSDVSATVTATPVDTTPPKAPTELVGIPSTGTVRLVWMASPDPDVGRYLVHRGREGGPLERMGSTVAPATAFIDRDVPVGRWRYAVSAQDRSSRANESERSSEVTVTVP